MSSIDIPKADAEQKLLDGVIDLHCHAAPCLLEKLFDEIEVAQQMRQVGDRGVLFKQHLLGANRIPFVRKAVQATARNIRKVGVSRCVMSTDAGTGRRIHPIEAFRLFIRAMEMQGSSRSEIDIMTRENPAKLLGI